MDRYQCASGDVNDGSHMFEPQSFPGYSHMGFEEAFIPLPDYEDVVRESPPREIIESTDLTFAEANGALMEFVANKCCYGENPAKNMVLTKLQATSAVHYILESFCESRSFEWDYEAYNGGHIPATRNPPGPWEVSVPVPQMFKEDKTKLRVPNSSVVKRCEKCSGSGRKECSRCNGKGKVRKRNAGAYQMERCYRCSGTGQNKCSKCYGSGKLCWFIRLTVKWKNHQDDYIVEKSALPSKQIKKVSGKTVLKENATRVSPVDNFPTQEINEASKDLVTKHSTKWPTQHILQQQQTIRIVPVTQVSYTNGGESGLFFVCGLENKVYFPDYPSQCCCGCSIL